MLKNICDILMAIGSTQLSKGNNPNIGRINRIKSLRSTTFIAFCLCVVSFLFMIDFVASGGIGSGVGNEIGSNSDLNMGAKKSGNFDHVNKHLVPFR